MKKRLMILLGVVLAFFGGLLAMPEIEDMKPSRIARNLPETFGGWVGTPEEPGEREKNILARDTEFERMSYVHSGGTLPAIQASLVFSGKNLSQSIHRPEVCLRAQGWEFMKESYFQFEDVLPNGEILPMKEIICRRVIMRQNEGGDPEPMLLPNGEKAYIWTAFYYTFFGHDRIMAGHYQRTREDIKDRIFKGYDQRWAYATFSSFITKKHDEQGIHRGSVEVLDEEGTKGHVKNFLKELLPKVVAEPGEGYDASLAEGKDLGS